MEKKTITIEIDEQDITNFNNACVAYMEVLESVRLGLSIPRKFEILRRYDDHDIDAREWELHSFYEMLKRKFEEE